MGLRPSKSYEIRRGRFSTLDRPRGVRIELPVVSGAANVEAECARCGGERRGVCHHLGQRSDAVPPDKGGGEVDGIQRAHG